MKSENDFRFRDEYIKYLKYYYAGLALQAVCVHYMIFDKKDRDKNIEIVVDLAETLVNKLEKI